MRQRHYRLIRWSCVFVATLLLGCEVEPAIISIEDFSSADSSKAGSPASQNLVSQDVDRQYDWPVASGLWQVSRPSGVAAVRQLKPGSLERRFAEIQAQRTSKIETAKTSDKPAPWEVDAYDLRPESRIWFQEILGEKKNELFQQLVVKIPASVKRRHLQAGEHQGLGYKVQLDSAGRQMAIVNDSLWLCRLPWRDWYGSPDLPPQESDEPGTPDRFDQIELSDTTQGTPVFAEFYGDKSMMIAAKGKNLYTIDCENQQVIASTDVGNPIVYLHVAYETGDAIIVDSVGKLYLLNHLLKQVIPVGTCDLDLPMPRISPEAARIATYLDASEGRVIKIKDLVVLEQFDVDLVLSSTPIAIRSGRIYDYWIEKNAIFKRPNYPNQAGRDRRTFRSTLYWDIQDVVDIHSGTDHQEFCIATLPENNDSNSHAANNDAAGESHRQWVGVEGVVGNRGFHDKLELPDLSSSQISVSGQGYRVCIASGDEITCYFRIGNYTLGVLGVQPAARELAWAGRLDELDALAKLIAELPMDRHGRRPQQLYSELVHGVGVLWNDAVASRDHKETEKEDRDNARQACEKLEAWAAKESTFALECKMRFHSFKAWRSRGHGYSSSVSQDNWQDFEKQNNLAMEIWNQIKTRDDLSAEAYSLFIELARDTGLDYKDVSETLSEAMQKYPIEDGFHHEMMTWLLEKWGGNRGSSAAYAAAVADAIGGARGDFVYSRLIARIAPNYPTGFFEHAQVDRGRVLRGISEGIRTEYWQYESTVSSLLLVVKSIGTSNTPQASREYANRADIVCQELAKYYKQRFPMATSSAAADSNQALISKYLPE
ncbi:MAG: hypothetical protein WBD20_26360 [Pirellulaceae bacterium]